MTGELVSRLNRLAQRRDAEGNYTDGNICEKAARALEALQAENVRLRQRIDWLQAELRGEDSPRLTPLASDELMKIVRGER